MDAFAAAVSLAVIAPHAPACPLTQSLVERYGISFSGFTKAIPAGAAPDTSHGGPFARIIIPDDSKVADGFRHAVVVDTKTKKAWILRTGGFVGVYEWYGPVDAGAASIEGCRLEPKA
jgi:hypothetical protein